MKVYAFEYTHCVYESSFTTMSMHATKRGAYKAMMKHKNDMWYAARETTWQDIAEIGWMERWQIREWEVLC